MNRFGPRAWMLAGILAVAAHSATYASPFAYISNTSDGTVSVIDTATDKVVGSPLPVGLDPVGIAVHPTGRTVYVANSGDATVSVYDATTGVKVIDVPVGGTPTGLAANPTGTELYVTNAADDSVSIIDASTNAVVTTVPVGNGPTGIVVHPAGAYAYVANSEGLPGGAAWISVLDTAARSVSANVTYDCTSGTCRAGPIAASADGGLVLVGNEEGLDLRALFTEDPANPTVGPSVPSQGVAPRGIAIHPASDQAYVTIEQGGGQVLVIDTDSLLQSGAIATGSDGATGISVLPDGSRLYVAHADEDAVAVIDTATNSVLATLAPVCDSGPCGARAFGAFIGAATPIVHVPADFPTIQAAINAAVDGDVVEVDPGLGPYLEHDISFLGKAITVRSTNPFLRAVVDAERLGRGFRFNQGEGEDSVLSGVRIENGLGQPVLNEGGAVIDPGFGGGILIRTASSPTIDNVVVTNSEAVRGGGIFCAGPSVSPVIRDSEITGNTATGTVESAGADARYAGQDGWWRAIKALSGKTRGGGTPPPDATGGGIAVRGCDVRLERTTVSGNSAASGGGVHVDQSNGALIVDSAVTDNDALWGGGLYFRVTDAGLTSPVISNSTVEGNRGAFGGAGMAFETSTVAIEESVITDNDASTSASGFGAGVAAAASSLSFVNSRLTANVADLDGGGLSISFGSEVSVDFTTIADNVAARGGGILVDPSSSADVNSSILWGDLPDEIVVDGAGSIDVDRSDVQGGFPGIGNIDADPLFGGPGGPYHIQDGSPVIDLASDSAPPPFDIDNMRRPWGAGNDMGFDEYYGPSLTLLVPTDFADVQSAIDAANPGDVVELEQDIFVESITLDKSITLRGSLPDAQTTIFGDGTTGVMTVITPDGDTQTVIENLTITGGFVLSGGAIFVDGSPTIRDCAIVENSAQNGGGIYISRGAARVERCTFFDNTAFIDGGGIYVEEIEGPAPQLVDLFLDDNHAIGGSGGGAYMATGTIGGRNCVIERNDAVVGRGGGLYLRTGAAVEDCRIGAPGLANIASRGGGAFLGGATMTNVALEGNEANSGGGVFVGNAGIGPPESFMSAITVIGNVAEITGGGIQFNRDAVGTLDGVSLVSGNSAPEGGGIYAGGSTTLDGAEIKDNVATDGPGGGLACFQQDFGRQLVMANTVVEGNASTLNNGGGLALSGNCNADIRDSVITDNRAEGAGLGGGIYSGGGAFGASPTTQTLTAVTVSNNAAAAGAGVYAENPVSDVIFRIERSSLIDNGTNPNPPTRPQTEQGGGIFAAPSSAPVVTNSVLSGNVARLGGGVYNNNSAALRLTNATLTGNDATRGGALFTYSTSQFVAPQVLNSILWDNAPDEIFVVTAISPTVTYSDVQLTDPQDVWPGEGNVNVDPGFSADPERPFALTTISSVIDAGGPFTPETACDGPPLDPTCFDFDGERRPFGQGVDLGADEVVPEESLPVIAMLDVGAGSPDGGELVTITGENFGAYTAVTFDDVDVEVVDVGTDALQILTPSWPALTSVAVNVSNGPGLEDSLANGFTFTAPEPSISTIVNLVTGDNTGSSLGEETVEISGVGFTDGVALFFGELELTVDPELSSDTLLTAVTPASPGGTVAVQVRDRFGRDNQMDMPAPEFTFVVDPANNPVIDGLSQTGGGTDGGLNVVVSGSFLESARLLVDGREVPFTYIDTITGSCASPPCIEFITPASVAGPGCSDVDVEITVVHPDEESDSVLFTYTPTQILNVAPGGSIQAAINSTQAGACILLATNPFPGYPENIDLGNRAITLMGDPDTPANVVINADGTGLPVVRMANNPGSGTLLRGLSLVRGNGGMIIDGGSTPRIEDVVIQSNTRSSTGGGMFVGGESAPRLVNVSVLTNTASSSGGGIFVDDGSTVSLEEQIIVLGNVSSGSGGGIFLSPNYALDIDNAELVIEGNQSNGYGGGLFIHQGSTLTVSQLTLTGNSADFGGGIAIFDPNAEVTLVDVVVEDNTADNEGGGIWVGNGNTVSVLGGRVSGNGAPFGGGIHLSADSNLVVDGVDVSGNTADTSGGGVFVDAAGIATIENTRLIGNRGFLGAGVYLGADTFGDFTRNEVACNVATVAPTDDCEANPTLSPLGAGVYSTANSVSFINNSLVNNAVEGCPDRSETGALHIDGGFLAPEVVNNIISGNVDYGLYCSTPSLVGRVEYNLFEGNASGPAFGCDPLFIVSGGTNVSGDPLLVDDACPDANDLGLLPGSPAIDAGDPTFPVPPGGGVAVDIGAKEFTP